MEKDLKSNVVKDEALKQSFAEIKKAAETGKTTVAQAPVNAAPVKTDAVKKDTPKTATKTEAKTAVKAETKTEAKKAETKAETKPAAKKAEAKAETKPAAKKAETKSATKTNTKSTTKKAETKTEAKKAETKTAPAKKTAVKSEVSTSLVLQLNRHDYDPAKIELDAIAAAKLIKSDVKVVDVYINIEDSAAYFTIDGKGSADYKIDL